MSISANGTGDGTGGASGGESDDDFDGKGVASSDEAQSGVGVSGSTVGVSGGLCVNER